MGNEQLAGGFAEALRVALWIYNGYRLGVHHQALEGVLSLLTQVVLLHSRIMSKTSDTYCKCVEDQARLLTSAALPKVAESLQA